MAPLELLLFHILSWGHFLYVAKPRLANLICLQLIPDVGLLAASRYLHN